MKLFSISIKVWVSGYILIGLLHLGCLGRDPYNSIHIQPTSLINKGPVLLIVAHQDDEIFILSRIRQHLISGDSVYIIWTALSFQVNKEYAFARKNESLNVMKTLGIPESHCYWLGFEDGKTYIHLGEIIDAIASITSQIQPRTVYVPAYEGGHIDHDIANYAVAATFMNARISSQIFEYPIYSAYSTFYFIPFIMRQYPPRLQTICRRLKCEEYEFILNCWAMYHSQRIPLGYFIKILPGEFRTFSYEYYRSLPVYDYSQPPLDGSIAYERYLRCTFDEFQTAINSIKLKRPK